MICHLCEEDKLSKEFPFEPLTDNCDHPLLHCLRVSIQNNNLIHVLLQRNDMIADCYEDCYRETSTKITV